MEQVIFAGVTGISVAVIIFWIGYMTGYSSGRTDAIREVWPSFIHTLTDEEKIYE